MRLPIQHPDYRYATVSNPYAAKLKALKGWVYSENETEEHRGKWREQFTNFKNQKTKTELSPELWVEIGCNTGHVTRAWAEQNPERLFIGIDWKFKIIHQGVEKAQKKDLKNLLFLRANVERIQYMFGEGEIDRLCLYFPDPWPKKAQQKNRFVKPSTLRDCAKIVKKGGVFHIKTDHAGYFEWMEKSLTEVLDVWKIEERTTDLHASHPNPHLLEIPDVTLFEKLFIKDKITIKSLTLRKI